MKMNNLYNAYKWDGYQFIKHSLDINKMYNFDTERNKWVATYVMSGYDKAAVSVNSFDTREEAVKWLGQQ